MGSTGYLLLSMVVLAVFFIYISKSGRAFIHMDFFRNRNYVTAILLVALTFGIQNSFSFLFPFMAQGVYMEMCIRDSHWTDITEGNIFNIWHSCYA